VAPSFTDFFLVTWIFQCSPLDAVMKAKREQKKKHGYVRRLAAPQSCPGPVMSIALVNFDYYFSGGSDAASDRL
jgi:hypothetical protein